MILLAAFGTVDFAIRRKAPGAPQNRALKFCALAWLVASLLGALNSSNRWIWSIHKAELQAFQSLHKDPGLCGIALFGRHWSETGGYSYLHRRVPMFVLDGPSAAASMRAGQSAFNTILAPRSTARSIPTSFKQGRCFSSLRNANDDMCLFRRGGRCDASSAADVEINRWLWRQNI